MFRSATLKMLRWGDCGFRLSSAVGYDVLNIISWGFPLMGLPPVSHPIGFSLTKNHPFFWVPPILGKSPYGTDNILQCYMHVNCQLVQKETSR